MKKKSAKKTSKSRAKSKSPSQSVNDPRPPSHLVVFRRPSEENLPLMTKVLKTDVAPSASVRSSCAVLEPKSKSAPAPRVYHRLGVAVADLSASQASELDSSQEVAFVVRNETRTIPPMRRDAKRPVPSAEPSQNEPLVNYLEGMRASIDSVQQFLTGERVAAPAALASGGGTARGGVSRDLDTPDHSWCLRQVGVGPGYTCVTGAGVKVAVLDTGIDLDHPDFDIDEASQTASFVPGETVQDGNDHGTHCAGVIGGPRTSVGGKRYGVAPDVELLIGKVLSDLGSGTDDQILDGIDWAVDQGADVISMSFGSLRGEGDPHARAYELVAQSLLLYEGILIVGAAGNSSSRPHFTAPVENPAAAPSIMAIAANDQDRGVAWFSCQQKDNIGILNLSGPGVGVYSAVAGGGFDEFDGTSMATPHVAGIAALYLEQDPNRIGVALRSALEANAVPLGSSIDFGSGLVQAP